MTTEDPHHREALTLLRRLEKMSDEALRPIAPQILHLIRDLHRIYGEDVRCETLRPNLSNGAG
jgi:hypothetical protein